MAARKSKLRESVDANQTEQNRKPKTVAVQFTAKQFAALELVAKERGVSRNDVMREATLREVINFRNKTDSKARLERIALQTSGGVVKSINDEADLRGLSTDPEHINNQGQLSSAREIFIEDRVEDLTSAALAGGHYFLEALLRYIQEGLQASPLFHSIGELD